MSRSRVWIGAVLIVASTVTYPTAAQTEIAPSLELGLGGGVAGHGAGSSGKALARLTISGWGLGVRVMGMDGERRKATACFLFCSPIESFWERSALLYRQLPLGDYRMYVGAGVGLLTGRRFIGDTTELEDVRELGFSFDLSLHIPPGSGFRFVPSAYGHVGSGGVAAGLMVGVALAG